MVTMTMMTMTRYTDGGHDYDDTDDSGRDDAVI